MICTGLPSNEMTFPESGTFGIRSLSRQLTVISARVALSSKTGGRLKYDMRLLSVPLSFTFFVVVLFSRQGGDAASSPSSLQLPLAACSLTCVGPITSFWQ